MQQADKTVSARMCRRIVVCGFHTYRLPFNSYWKVRNASVSMDVWVKQGSFYIHNRGWFKLDVISLRILHFHGGTQAILRTRRGPWMLKIINTTVLSCCAEISANWVNSLVPWQNLVSDIFEIFDICTFLESGVEGGHFYVTFKLMRYFLGGLIF